MNNYYQKVFKKVLSLAGFIAVLLAISTPSVEGQWNGSGSITDPYEIHSVADLNMLASNVNAGNSYSNVYFKLMRDIGIVTQMIGDDVNYFAGHFDGDNHKITVNINSNATNVGLFSQTSGDIESIIIDGSVVGGNGSQNIGGIVGQMLSGHVHFFTNLAEVTGAGPTSSVGGIVGIAICGYGGDIGISGCTNNATITGGQYVAGIVGRAYSIGGSLVVRLSRNAGTIKGNGTSVPADLKSYIAGIVSHFGNAGHMLLHGNTNIGKILSSNFNYVGGIVAFSEGVFIYSCSNAGILEGAKNYVGGIVGWLYADRLEGCINTNWIDLGTAQNYGAIVGLNNGVVTNCYYDSQMCAIGGINNQYMQGQAEGLPTTSMLGSNLQNLLPIDWIFENNLYPRTIYYSNHPVVLLAAAPIYLQNVGTIMERLNYVTQPFTVSNWNPNPGPWQIPFEYWWGWYPGGNFIPSSMMNYISVPPPTSSTATILVPRGGWDSLSVRLNYPTYNYNGFYTGYTIIFEKIVPINVRP